VADLLQLDNAGVVDIGGGTTGIAIVKQGRVTYSADEATGGHHISLTLAGNRGIGLEEAEQYKRSHAGEIWPVVKPVYEKMAEIVARHIAGQGIVWLAGGACMQPGVHALFRQALPGITGAFTAAQPVYDPAGNRQQREGKSGGDLCKLNCRRRCSTPSIR
jgi:ethanolamine utilization protein EutJ